MRPHFRIYQEKRPGPLWVELRLPKNDELLIPRIYELNVTPLRNGVFSDDQVKMKSLGWTLIQDGECACHE